MDSSISATLLLLAGLVAANVPFFTDRLFGVWSYADKSMGVRLLELVFLYGVVGGLGLWLEQRAGQIATQGWEFYAVTATLFVTFAFPGFVYRYLLKRHV